MHQVVFIYLAIGAVLLPIGAVCLAYGIKPVEVSQRYDQNCFSPNFTGSTNGERQQYIWQVCIYWSLDPIDAKMYPA